MWLRGNNFFDACTAGDEINCCPQGFDGSHGPDLDRLPAGSYVRQPQGLRRSRGVQRVRPPLTYPRSADPALQRCTLDHSRRLDHQRDRAHVRRFPAVVAGAPRAWRRKAVLQQQGADRSAAHLRLLHPALGWGRHCALRDLSLAAPDVEHHSSGWARGRPLRPGGRTASRSGRWCLPTPSP